MKNMININHKKKATKPMISIAVVDDKTCHICLQNYPPIIIYEGTCKCSPPIHIECLEAWHKVRPGTCPICLKESLDIHPLLHRIPNTKWHVCNITAKILSAIFCCCCVTPCMMLLCCFIQLT